MSKKYLTILISIIWGFGLACLLKTIFANGECIIIEEKMKNEK
jgi:hypothetical protein